jgi:hypothetical protein
MGRLRTRFWIETGLGTGAGLLFVLTLFWRDWLEAFGFDPDQHSGSAEWLVAAAILSIAVVAGLAARLEWQAAAFAR